MNCKVCGSLGPRNKWEAIRMHTAGWFFQKNGDAYCPDHLPDWVVEWRDG